MKLNKSIHGQVIAPNTVPMDQDTFKKENHTMIHWLGNAGIMIHSHGTNLMIDPLLEGFDMPLFITMPILAKDIPQLDALLVTHIDNDHFSRATGKAVRKVCASYHAPRFVAEEMQKEGIPGIGHDIHEIFSIHNVEITLTPALHNWQNNSSKYNYREWKEEDYCGYWIKTMDGTIWLPGDSKLLPQHLAMLQPDMILFDFADNEWHITLEGAIQLANTYPNADLLCIHWGCVDAPTMTPFNGNPETLLQRIKNPERIHIVGPGEAVLLTRKD